VATRPEKSSSPDQPELRPAKALAPGRFFADQVLPSSQLQTHVPTEVLQRATGTAEGFHGGGNSRGSSAGNQDDRAERGLPVSAWRSRRLYLIERGQITLTLPMTVRGKEQDVIVEEPTSGQAVGWSALVPPYEFTLAATAPLETVIIALPREALHEYFAANPAVGYKITLVGRCGRPSPATVPDHVVARDATPRWKSTPRRSLRERSVEI
jgi:hypothetical protein